MDHNVLPGHGLRGYESLRSSSAWYDASARGRIQLTGDDRARLLHAMSTNHIQELTPGKGCYAFFLTAQGRILADAAILCLEDRFLVETEPETRETLYAHLDKFIIMDDVTLEDLGASTVEFAIEGPLAQARVRELGAPVPDEDFAVTEWGSRLIFQAGDERFRIIAPVQDRAELTARLGDEASLEAAEVTRIERGVPRFGSDITEKHLVQETRLMHAVHFQKGCYLGQEIVERVRSRGAVHKGLAAVAIDGANAIAPGSPIVDDQGSKCGDLMSNAYSPALGRVAGFAVLRTDQLGENAKPMSVSVNGASVPVSVR